MKVTMTRNDETTFTIIIELLNHHRNIYDRVISYQTKNGNLSIIYDDGDFIDVAKYEEKDILKMTVVC